VKKKTCGTLANFVIKVLKLCLNLINVFYMMHDVAMCLRKKSK